MLDLTEVILNDGKVIHREVTLELTSLKYRFGDFQIQKATPVELTIENIGERKLSVNGKVHLTVCIPCARCLEPTASGLDIQFENELDVNDEDYIEGYSLNVDQLVHDEALLVWPERVLCRKDCKGLCITCGQNLNHGSCSCRPTDLDPRMAKILDIFSQAGNGKG